MGPGPQVIHTNSTRWIDQNHRSHFLSPAGGARASLALPKSGMRSEKAITKGAMAPQLEFTLLSLKRKQSQSRNIVR